MVDQRAKPLHGVRVLDLGQIYAGGYAGLLLAQAGADVIKVEPPGGENLRRRSAVGGGAYPFVMLNSNKRGVVIDLKQEEGKELLRNLVRESDALLENFRPGTMDRLGLGREALQEINPNLVYVEASGYGRNSLYSALPAMDLTVQAVSGVMSITGFADSDPVKAGPAIADFLAGVHMFAGLCAALYGRERGTGATTVEVSLQESVYPSLMSALGLYFSEKEHPEDTVWRTGNRHSGNAEAPYNTYEVGDGHIAILSVTDEHWRSLAHLIGGDELARDERFTSLAGRVERMDEVDDLVHTWARGFTRAELVPMLQEARVPCAPVNELPEVVNDPNLWQRRMLQKIDHPELGEVVGTSSPIRFGEGPRSDLVASPLLGQHTREVLHDLLGFESAHIDGLVEKGVVQCANEQ